jgi:hypothetical protein
VRRFSHSGLFVICPAGRFRRPAGRRALAAPKGPGSNVSDTFETLLAQLRQSGKHLVVELPYAVRQAVAAIPLEQALFPPDDMLLPGWTCPFVLGVR